MSKIKVTIQSVAAQSGVEYVVVGAQPGCIPSLAGSAGDHDYQVAAALALGLFDHTEDNEIRVVVGKKTIHCRRSAVARAALITETGHPIVKSVSRLLGKLLTRAGQGATVSTVSHREPAPVDQGRPAGGSLEELARMVEREKLELHERLGAGEAAAAGSADYTG